MGFKIQVLNAVSVEVKVITEETEEITECIEEVPFFLQYNRPILLRLVSCPDLQAYQEVPDREENVVVTYVMSKQRYEPSYYQPKHACYLTIPVDQRHWSLGSAS